MIIILIIHATVLECSNLIKFCQHELSRRAQCWSISEHFEGHTRHNWTGQQPTGIGFFPV